MATSNFKPMKYDMPLIVGGMDVENEWDDYYEVECIKERLADFNDKLRHFEVSLWSGYYEGWQFDVKQSDEYWDYEDLADMTDEDADYYYGDTADNIRAEFEQDLKNIRAFLNECKANGYKELGVVGTFSNGETVYREVA